jgi:hypothetical protein
MIAWRYRDTLDKRSERAAERYWQLDIVVKERE